MKLRLNEKRTEPTFDALGFRQPRRLRLPKWPTQQEAPLTGANQASGGGGFVVARCFGCDCGCQAAEPISIIFPL